MNYKQIIKVLNEINLPIYITGHKNPDFDSISSCLALATYLNSLNKSVNVLLKKEDENIVFNKDDLKFIKNEVNAKNYCLIILDLNEISRLGQFDKEFNNASLTINIDHHMGNATKANYVFSKPKISSTCEIIYNIIYISNKKLLEDKNLCQNIYLGIMTDTNCFTRRLTNKTLFIAQKLINKGVNYFYLNQQTLWKRSKSELQAVGELCSKIQENRFFKYVIVDKSIPPFKDLDLNSLTKKVAEDLRRLEYLDIFVFIVLKEKNFITGKIMTNNCEIADKLASLLGGGGHKKEAGFTCNFTVSQILEKLSTYFTNLNH